MWKRCAAVISKEKRSYLITVEIDEIVEIVFLWYLIDVLAFPYHYVMMDFSPFIFVVFVPFMVIVP